MDENILTANFPIYGMSQHNNYISRCTVMNTVGHTEGLLIFASDFILHFS